MMWYICLSVLIGLYIMIGENPSQVKRNHFISFLLIDMVLVLVAKLQNWQDLFFAGIVIAIFDIMFASLYHFFAFKKENV